MGGSRAHLQRQRRVRKAVPIIITRAPVFQTPEFFLEPIGVAPGSVGQVVEIALASSKAVHHL